MGGNCSIMHEMNHGDESEPACRRREEKNLYALLIAPASHLPHIFSGDLPNGFSAMWRRVDEVIYEGRGEVPSRSVPIRGWKDLHGHGPPEPKRAQLIFHDADDFQRC